MLRRFTNVEISDFGCAFNAYRREVVTPMLGSIGRQKFTKALILSGGASVTEVEVGTRRARGLAVLAAAADAARPPLLAGFWPQPIQWAGVVLGFVCALAAGSARRLRRRLLDRHVELPGPLFLGAAVIFVLGCRASCSPSSGIPEPDPAGGRGPPLYAIEREL